MAFVTETSFLPVVSTMVFSLDPKASITVADFLSGLSRDPTKRNRKPRRRQALGGSCNEEVSNKTAEAEPSELQLKKPFSPVSSRGLIELDHNTSSSVAIRQLHLNKVEEARHLDDEVITPTKVNKDLYRKPKKVCTYSKKGITSRNFHEKLNVDCQVIIDDSSFTLDKRTDIDIVPGETLGLPQNEVSGQLQDQGSLRSSPSHDSKARRHCPKSKNPKQGPGSKTTTKVDNTGKEQKDCKRKRARRVSVEGLPLVRRLPYVEHPSSEADISIDAEEDLLDDSLSTSQSPSPARAINEQNNKTSKGGNIKKPLSILRHNIKVPRITAGLYGSKYRYPQATPKTTRSFVRTPGSAFQYIPLSSSSSKSTKVNRKVVRHLGFPKVRQLDLTKVVASTKTVRRSSADPNFDQCLPEGVSEENSNIVEDVSSKQKKVALPSFAVEHESADNFSNGDDAEHLRGYFKQGLKQLDSDRSRNPGSVDKNNDQIQSTAESDYRLERIQGARRRKRVNFKGKVHRITVIESETLRQEDELSRSGGVGGVDGILHDDQEATDQCHSKEVSENNIYEDDTLSEGGAKALDRSLGKARLISNAADHVSTTPRISPARDVLPAFSILRDQQNSPHERLTDIEAGNMNNVSEGRPNTTRRSDNPEQVWLVTKPISNGKRIEVQDDIVDDPSPKGVGKHQARTRRLPLELSRDIPSSPPTSNGYMISHALQINPQGELLRTRPKILKNGANPRKNVNLRPVRLKSILKRVPSAEVRPTEPSQSDTPEDVLHSQRISSCNRLIFELNSDTSRDFSQVSHVKSRHLEGLNIDLVGAKRAPSTADPQIVRRHRNVTTNTSPLRTPTRRATEKVRRMQDLKSLTRRASIGLGTTPFIRRKSSIPFIPPFKKRP